MRTSNLIRNGASVGATDRVDVRLVRIIEAANHARKQNADPKLKARFTRKADNH